MPLQALKVISEYNSYYATYIDKVGQGSLLENLAEGMVKTVHFFEGIPSDKMEYRYAEGKWSPKEVLQHLIDTERIFSYRALFIARAKNANLAGMDQDEFAATVNANAKSVELLLEEYVSVRTATITLFKSFGDVELLKIGKASASDLSVRASGYIICGHELHHIDIVRERYL